jgi:hypothetical protein
MDHAVCGFIIFVVWIHFQTMLYGCTRVVLLQIASVLALPGWPAAPHWQEMDLSQYILETPEMMLCETCTWISVFWHWGRLIIPNRYRPNCEQIQQMMAKMTEQQWG